MDDETFLGGIAMVCISVMYGAYVTANPGSDGAILAASSSAVVGIITFLIGRFHGTKQTKKQLPRTINQARDEKTGD